MPTILSFRSSLLSGHTTTSKSVEIHIQTHRKSGYGPAVILEKGERIQSPIFPELALAAGESLAQRKTRGLWVATGCNRPQDTAGSNNQSKQDGERAARTSKMAKNNVFIISFPLCCFFIMLRK